MSGEGCFKGRILLADDDVIFRSLCVAKLKSFGLDVVEAGDGVEAWHLLKDDQYSLALLDIDMPNMNGVALVQCIRTHPQTRHLPVVMITSREDVSSVRLALQAGATSYLTKPVNWSLFNDHVQHLLTLGQGLVQGTVDTGNERAVLAASRALNALYAREFGKPANDPHAIAERSRSLQGLGQLLSKIDSASTEQIDICRSLESIAEGTDLKATIKAPDRMFEGVQVSFMALLSELAASGALIQSDGQGRELLVERRERDLRVGLNITGDVRADGERLGFALQKMSVLAALNEGELFIDDNDDSAGFSFGVTFDRPLDAETTAYRADEAEVATPV